MSMKTRIQNTKNDRELASSIGVPYGNRTRVAAVKEKRFTGIQRKPAAWIAPKVVKGTLRTSYWALNGPA